MKVFRSRQDPLMDAMIIGLILSMIVMMIVTLRTEQATFIEFVTIIGLPTLLIATLLLPRPRYTIDTPYFSYRTCIFRGKIAIDKIHKIEIGKTLWVGFKPAAARKGLIIHYNKYEEIYISPDGNDNFVNELLQYNPAIKIIRSA
ncbi:MULTISPECIES: PH domain-containing protein [Sphingobacterium]|uniref:PH domain-containing protein n=1 Tax=Sphingobacterium TaxID=28453 RepID=UPI001048E42C|nr:MULTISPECIES: PH domain-containing protein [Sphingobacterium]MCW2262306.1 hypothetical protein [Sphingobacterium kitahiroshimense]TCR12946.1 PH (Pleckstrin Homology) domain-containing protein [Sphingobacterium sp. JUb78]